MPIERSPGRKLTTAIQGLTSDRRGRELGGGPVTEGITTETIEAILDNGAYRMAGINRELTTTGAPYGLLAGMQVSVAWRNGEPVAILSHSARRAQFVPRLGGVALPVVEQVFPFSGIEKQVWFRNYDQFKPIQFVTAAGQPGDDPAALGMTSSIDQLVWGGGDADFFVVDGRGSGGTVRLMLVYRLLRPKKNEPFPRGATVKAKLVQSYNLTADPFVYATHTITVSLGPTIASRNWTIEGGAFLVMVGASNLVAGRAGVRVAGVAPNGDLLVIMSITTTDAGQPSQSFVLSHGNFLINHTKHRIVANHVAGSLGTPVFLTTAAPPNCNQLYSVSAVLSPGVVAADAGTLEVMSFRLGDPPDTDVGVANNYLLTKPATIFGGGACYVPRAAVTLEVVGEFAQAVPVSFPGGTSLAVAQVPRVLTSRRLVFWAPFTANGILQGPAQALDALRAVVSTLTGDANLIFDVAQFFGPVIQPTTAGSLIYSAHDELAPYDHQFFVAGHNRTTGAVAIDLTALKRLSALQRVAPLAKATSQTQIDFLFFEQTAARLQVLDSRAALGTLFQPGPL